jgi:hypothetical protein
MGSPQPCSLRFLAGEQSTTRGRHCPTSPAPKPNGGVVDRWLGIDGNHVPLPTSQLTPVHTVLFVQGGETALSMSHAFIQACPYHRAYTHSRKLASCCPKVVQRRDNPRGRGHSGWRAPPVLHEKDAYHGRNDMYLYVCSSSTPEMDESGSWHWARPRRELPLGCWVDLELR